MVGGRVAAALLFGEEAFELGRQLLRGGHLLAVEQGVVRALTAGFRERVVLPLQRGDQLGNLGRLRDLPVDFAVRPVGGQAERVTGQVQAGGGAEPCPAV